MVTCWLHMGELDFSKYEVHVCYNTVVETIMELTYKRIERASKETQGTHVYDSRTKTVTHLIGMYSNYVRDTAIFKAGVSKISLVANENEEVVDDKAIAQFDALSHIRHFENALNFFELDVHDWNLCRVAENTSVDIRIYGLIGKPHVGCPSHK